MSGWGARSSPGGGSGPSIPGNTPAPDPTKEVYGEITGVLINVETTILSFVAPPQNTAGKPIIHLMYANFGGTNMSHYTMTINGVNANQHYTYFGGDITGQWDWRTGAGGGKALFSGDIVVIKTQHCRPDAGDFYARLCYREIY